jgi:hypothetical protein
MSMDKPEADNDTSSTSTQEPGDERRAKGDSKETFENQPLDEAHVRTQEQRNQLWTAGSDESDPRRHEGEPLRTDSQPAETLDMPQDLEDKLDDVMANPHSDAEKGTDTQGTPGSGD